MNIREGLRFMKVFKLSFLFLSAALFLAGCTKSDVADQIYNQQNQPYEIGRIEEGFLEDDELIGRESLDLQALGAILEKANNAEDFEYLLNSDDGINNLDLNDDGYADYISVREFGNDYDDERGFSLFSMFGPELIQEIAQIIFDRDRYDDGYYDDGYNDGYYPGSRVLIRGNDYLYGDDYYYETNWLDRQVTIVDWVFSDRDNYYQSPYYYQNYPSYYEPYTIVETPVYLTRIEQYYYSPVFVQTAQPTITEIKVESPYRDVSLSQAYMKVPKPERVERQQQVLVERNKQRAQFEREKPGKMKEVSGREDKQFNDNPNRSEKPDKIRNERQQQVRDQIRETRERPNKPERVERQQPQKQQRIERQQPQKFERPQPQPRVERQQRQRPQPQQQRVERQQQQQRPQPRVERQQPKPQQVRQQRQPPTQENRVQQNKGGGKQNGGGNNPGGGGNKGGGKGKGKP